MIPVSSKIWFGVALVAAPLGLLTGLVGHQPSTAAACAMLLVVGLFLGWVGLTARRADEPSPAGEAVAAVVRPVAPSVWPAVAALGAVITMIGLVVGRLYVVAGLLVLAAAAVEWTASNWADRFSIDPAYNRALRNKLFNAAEIPVFGVLGTALVAISFSRVLLAMGSAMASVVIAGVVAVVFLVIGSVAASRKKLPSAIGVSIVAIVSVMLVGSGVAGALKGERKHEGEHGAAHGETHDEKGHSDEKAAEGESEAPSDVTLHAENLAWEAEIEAAAGPITLTLENLDKGVPHNVHVHAKGNPRTKLENGIKTQVLKLDLKAGEYEYMCDVHPTMVGTLVVK